MNKLEKAIYSIINREGEWLSLFRGDKQIGSVSVSRWKDTKKEFMEECVTTERNGDGTYSLWITIDGIEAFFNADSFEVEQW